MICYCCHAPATRREGFVPLCDLCAGAGFVHAGDADWLGWSEEKTRRMFRFECPVHGVTLPLEITNIHEIGWRKTKSGSLTWVLGFDVLEARLF